MSLKEIKQNRSYLCRLNSYCNPTRVLNATANGYPKKRVFQIEVNRRQGAVSWNPSWGSEGVKKEQTQTQVQRCWVGCVRSATATWNLRALRYLPPRLASLSWWCLCREGGSLRLQSSRRKLSLLVFQNTPTWAEEGLACLSECDLRERLCQLPIVLIP